MRKIVMTGVLLVAVTVGNARAQANGSGVGSTSTQTPGTAGSGNGQPDSLGGKSSRQGSLTTTAGQSTGGQGVSGKSNKAAVKAKSGKRSGTINGSSRSGGRNAPPTGKSSNQ